MPLLDHFHPPLFPIRRWESFHSHWAGCITADFNARLPKRFFAETEIHLGRHVEADVAEVELTGGRWNDGGDSGGAVATLTEVYAPPAVTATVPGHFPDDILVEIKDTHRDYRVVAVVELVCPSNKDRPETRADFVGKLTTYLSRGIGVIVIDVVSTRTDNLHDLWADVTASPSAKLTPSPVMYAVSYSPRMDGDAPVLDVWARPLAVGQSLPELPLGLKGYGCIRVDLDATYTEACERSGLV